MKGTETHEGRCSRLGALPGSKGGCATRRLPPLPLHPPLQTETLACKGVSAGRTRITLWLTTEPSDIVILWEEVTNYLWRIVSESDSAAVLQRSGWEPVYKTLSKLNWYPDTHSITPGCGVREVRDVILSKASLDSSKNASVTCCGNFCQD